MLMLNKKKIFKLGCVNSLSISFAIVIAFLYSSQVNAMSVIGFKICLASPASGVITQDGNSISGATLFREVNWKGEVLKQEAVTDTDGRFSFSALFSRSLWAFMPSHVSIPQKTTIFFQGNSYLAWELDKSNFDVDGEHNSGQAIVKKEAKPFVVSCELSDENRSRTLPGTVVGVHGICFFESELK